MRRHGWELPFHPLQVVAIAVFISLAFAFYVFFAPFIGTHFMQLISISCYSPLVVSVFGLYIWCAATNPADPAVLHSKKYLGSSASLRTSPSLFSWGKNESSTEPSILTQQSSVQSIIEAEDLACEQNQLIVCLGGLSICLHNPKAPLNEDRLYCSLCEVEILKYSKHCRVCDKCVDHFDHHCRWINNCIGQRNYRIFIALMVSGICMLVLQWSVGVWVIARCFLNRMQFEEDIMNKLGGSFTVVPFLIVVAVCTVVSAFITLPLCQLCLFHVLLIHKGISTYDYIIAMREQDQQFGAGESLSMRSPYTTPSTSPEVTGASAMSSMGALHHHSPWHTPPNIYDKGTNNSDKEKRSNVEAAKEAQSNGALVKKPPTKISPWALARLNPENALRAAAEARRKSSVLRPLADRAESGFIIPETDISGEYTSGEVIKDLVVPKPLSIERESRLDNLLLSSKIKTARCQGSHLDNRAPARPSTDEAKKFSDGSSGSAKVAVCLTPLQLEARNAFCRNDLTVEDSVSASTTPNDGSPDIRISCESSESNISTSEPQRSEFANTDSTAMRPITLPFLRSTSCDGYEASGGESADDSDPHRSRPGLQRFHLWNDKVNRHADRIPDLRRGLSPSIMMNHSFTESTGLSRTSSEV